MKHVAYVLAFIWMIIALLHLIFFLDSEWLIIGGIVSLTGSALLFAFEGIKMLWQRKARLRPLNAIALIPVLFFPYVGLMFVLERLLEEEPDGFARLLVQSAAFAVIMSLYLTAYRKPR